MSYPKEQFKFEVTYFISFPVDEDGLKPPSKKKSEYVETEEEAERLVSAFQEKGIHAIKRRR